MADINLLANEKRNLSWGPAGAGFIVKILAGVLVLMVIFYIFLRWQTSRTRAATVKVQARTAQLRAEALADKDRGEVVTRQGQLQSLDGLIKNHLYWSGLLPELARVTLKSASYATVNADATGVLNLDVIVPTYADADKYLQVFDLPQFNQQFSDVKVLSIAKIQQDTSVLIQLKVQLKFNPDFIRKTL